MNILGMDFLAKIVEFFYLRNPMLILTVFPASVLNCRPI